jgi:uncharacterized protein YcbX
MLAGTVISLQRWPVKSLGGEEVDALVLDGRGAAGDRTHALYDNFKDAPRRLTARQAPRMLLWQAAYPETAADELVPDDPPRPVLTAPDGRTFAWDDPSLPPALGADLGREVTLRRDVRGQQDLGETVLITTAATQAAVDATLGDIDIRRWRTNVHVAFDGVPAHAEERWEHGTARVGEAELVLLHPCLRCVIPTRHPETAAKRADVLRWLTRERAGIFGINARPVHRAVIRVGDRVVVTPPAAPG